MTSSAAKFIDITKAIEQCFPPIAQTKVVLTTSNDGWNNLATGFVEGISGPLSNDLITKIGNLIFGKTSDWQDIGWDLLGSQAGIIVFVSIGVIFSVLTLIGALVTCIWACTCRRSSKGVTSPCMNITGIVLAFISFGFIVAGIVLYALSTDSFVNGVLDAPKQLNVIVDNVNIFTKEATNEVGCSVREGFSSISSEVYYIPDEVIAKVKAVPDVSNVLDPDYKTIGELFKSNKKAVDDIVASLQAALTKTKISEDPLATAAVKDALTPYAAFDALLDPTAPVYLPQTLTVLGEQVTKFDKDMEKLIQDQVGPIATTASQTVNATIKTVNDVVDGAVAGIQSIVDQVQQAINTITKFENDLNKNNDVTGWIKAGFKSVIIVPCVIALLAAFVAFLVGLFFAFKKSSLPSKGCCSASCTLVTLSIIVLTITFVVMLPASAVMTLGYGAQLVCQPFFYDEKLTALQAVDDLMPPITIPSMTPGSAGVPLKFSEMMVACKAQDSFMKAVHGDEIIDVSQITKAINSTDMTNQLNKAIDNANIQPLPNNDVTTLNAALGQIQLMPDLKAATDADAADIDPIIAAMQSLNDTLQPYLDSVTAAAGSAAQFTTEANIKEMLKKTSGEFVTSMYDDLVATANQFTSDLMSQTAPCTPVYQSYEDMGMIACEQIGGGVQGMWAAAGLAALFFLPTVIAVFCVASALRGGKAKEMPLLAAHDEDDPFKLPPMQGSPTVSPSAPQQHDSLPRLTVDTTAAGLAAAHHDEAYLATAPIASAGSDPWESAYRHPDVYPYNQPAATKEFVDPLAYPAAAPAVATPVGAYETAGPSAYPRINVTATNRYYDNQAYTPSTLTRF